MGEWRQKGMNVRSQHCVNASRGLLIRHCWYTHTVSKSNDPGPGRWDSGAEVQVAVHRPSMPVQSSVISHAGEVFTSF